MTFLTEPRVSVLAFPMFQEPDHLRTEVFGEATTAECLAEYAGRICYMSQNNPGKRTTGEYLVNILKQGHGSVLEHAQITLLLEGISRSCTHELVRHRAGFGYSQLSQRYVDESDTAFVIPPAYLEVDNAALDAWKDHMLAVRALYTREVERLMGQYLHIQDRTQRRKMAREAARSVLPNATETKIVVSANLRAWRTMLELRTGTGADAEMRRLAVRILETIRPLAPAVFGDFEVMFTPTGPAAVTIYHKV